MLITPRCSAYSGLCSLQIELRPIIIAIIAIVLLDITVIAAYITLHQHAAPGRMTQRNTKAERLEALKSLNRHPERVRAPWFQTGTFFDAQDLVQVKYEMLRHVSQDGASKADSAALFGLSRPAFYQAEAALDREGLAGLLPRRRGPKGAHKLTAQIMSFIERRQVEDPEIHARALAQEIKAQLKLSVHPRSIERALARKKKLRLLPPR
jgi:transposase